MSERPIRLISMAPDTIRLVTTAGWEQMPRYATLSYCWGAADFLKLTTDTLDVFFNRIVLEDLPKTFRDAIAVVQKFDIQYIWIDALCIIQDLEDHSDWLKESSLMRSIYDGSYLNIAAASTPSVHDGCFSMPADFCGDFLARVETKDRCRVQKFHLASMYARLTTESHLASRAWALQERLLAPRTVYIGDQGFLWECRSTTASEFMPAGILDFTFTGRGQQVRSRQEAWDWKDLIVSYSKARLSNASDKLPALSGIARRQSEAEGDEYLAGMWRCGLVRQLAWRQEFGGILMRPEWRAPSWPWTSVDGSIIPSVSGYKEDREKHDGTYEDYVQVIDAFTSLAGPDRFGAVTHGELRLACSVMLRGSYQGSSQYAVVRSAVSNPDESTSCAEALEFPIFMDAAPDDGLQYGDSVVMLPLFGENGAVGRTAKQGISGKDQDSENSFEDYPPRPMVYGMVLQQKDATKGRFQRVGAFLWSTMLIERHFHRRPEDYHAFMRAIEEVGASECSEIQENMEMPEAKYVITIV